MLRQAGGGALPGLLRPRPILDARRQPVETRGVEVVAKTGTHGLRQRARRLHDRAAAARLRDLRRRPGARARIRPEERAKPPGAAAWAARARAQEQALLRRWAALYA